MNIKCVLLEPKKKRELSWIFRHIKSQSPKTGSVSSKGNSQSHRNQKSQINQANFVQVPTCTPGKVYKY